MSKNLLIVESPGKIKKIQSFLGSDFIVKASRGHIMDLDPSSLALDPDNNFEPSYIIYKDKKAVVADIKKTCSLCQNLSIGKIYLAADEDREGEFIAESLKIVLKLKDSDYHRAVFHEITQDAILKAIKLPRKIDKNLVYAQQTRRFLDRIVGYKLSPLLSKIPDLSTDITRYKLGAGRVQSVIVKIIIDKENDITNFLESSRSAFYEGKGEFTILLKDHTFVLGTVLYTINPLKKLELIKDSDDVYNQVLEIMNKLKDAKWKLVDIKKRNISRSPSAPFITSSLQRDASTKLHWPIAKTMQIAQKLYEAGYITYMRTDSSILSDDAHKRIKDVIINQYGNEYYTYKQYTSKSANAQEAHEAIRPTDLLKINISDDDSVTDLDKLYKLIWKKTVSSQMSKAQIESTQMFISPFIKINFKFKSEDFLMVGSISRIIFDGYLKLYKDLDSDESLLNITIPDNFEEVEIIPQIIKIKESLTSPPSRYNESSLVEILEKLGIGRPSTYATMIEKIQSKDFVRIENVLGKEKKLKELIYNFNNKKLEVIDTKMFLGKENKRIVPTNIGFISNKFLVNNFPQIIDISFTANMETQLDEIAIGKKDWINVLKSYYDIITGQIQSFLKSNYIKSNPNTELVTDNDQKIVVYINNNNNNIVGVHPETNKEIIFTKTKFGYAIKMFSDDIQKDIWVNVKEKPNLDYAVELFKIKLNPNLKSSSIIKILGDYQIKSGLYGPYVQTGAGNKGIKFYKIVDGIIPENMTLEDCKKICKQNKKQGKTTKKIKTQII